MHIDSEYIQTDSSHVAFHMIRPEMVIEISINDILTDANTSGITNHILEQSEVLLREVYKKEVKDKLMVIKFLVWKTNKEHIDENYPAYVMHYTNFSSDRKDPLQREVRISNNRDQILAIAQDYIESNVKKGWVKVQ